MVDIRSGFDVTGATYASVADVAAIRPPFPDLGGTLVAAYLFGTKYAQFCPDPIGRALGPRYDWSGNGYHLNRLGLNVFDEWWQICSTTPDRPTTPFSVASLESDPAQGFTMGTFHWAEPSARAVYLIRAVDAGVQEGTHISLLPQTSSGTVRVTGLEAGVAHSSTLTPLTNELNAITMYAGHQRDTDRTMYTRAPGQALRVASPNLDDINVDQSDALYMGGETGAGTGFNRQLACFFYRGARTETELGVTIPEYFSTFHAACNSGLTLP